MTRGEMLALADAPSAFEKRVRAGRKSWRCFHCGDVFYSSRTASSHFGLDQLQTPGCVAVLRHGEVHLLDRIRDLEMDLQRYRDEGSDLMRWAATKSADHAQALVREEERGYAKGVADTLAMPDAELAEARAIARASLLKEDGNG